MARQLGLLEAFVSGRCEAPEFAAGWWAERRAAQTAGERVGRELAALLDRVFMILEDYTPDPDLREQGDLTDAELREIVRSAAEADS